MGANVPESESYKERKLQAAKGSAGYTSEFQRTNWPVYYWSFRSSCTNWPGNEKIYGLIRSIQVASPNSENQAVQNCHTAENWQEKCLERNVSAIKTL